jgi:hypothetical protein
LQSAVTFNSIPHCSQRNLSPTIGRSAALTLSVARGANSVFCAVLRAMTQTSVKTKTIIWTAAANTDRLERFIGANGVPGRCRRVLSSLPTARIPV